MTVTITIKDSTMDAPSFIPPVDPVVPEPATTPDPTTDDGGPEDERDATIASLKSEAAKWRRALRDREAELNEVRLASASDAERAIAAAREDGAKEYRTKWRRSVVDTAALTVLAERGVSATGPALRCLDLDDVDVDDNGQIDRVAIAAKVDELLRQYPIFGPNTSGSLPAMPTVTGDNQRRVTVDARQRSGTLTDAETERLLRYGLGRGT